MKLLKFSLLCFLSVAFLGSCVKQNYTSPPDTSHLDPNLTVNTTLRDLSTQALLMNTGQYRVLGDTTVYGIVIADDKSGNFYKQIVIQDSTGGIVVTLDKTTVYGDFPIGRKVYVKLKGLLLINYKGLPEITYSVSATGSTTGIPSTLISNYLVKASYPNTVAPLDVTVDQLFGNPGIYYNTLVRISNVEFDAGSAGIQYAAPTSTGSYASSRNIVNADHTATLVMYNSAYATFQSAITPSGSGALTTVFSSYNGAVQLLIRDTTDVQFTSPRFP